MSEYCDDQLYWSYNLPLQMWPSDDGWRVLNYMPRKEYCQYLEDTVTKDELESFCGRAAGVLRNLADLFEALGRGEINYIYYPDKDVAEAIAACLADRKEAQSNE